ncbi:anti-sigma factor [Nitratireductor sp. ZSWI3]|uniref:anti-sigma factor family protein n=1 Tax=Nitratireductor sp. ZSWI3 TaxID=2966359 RepID=UPI00214FD6DC|nr:zf-HC2 domain-containing protein [Nitratireductor sp. ZSWI3]MCR4265089.1 zf-HC2 domain-containing protein [Nitratireductor sp. ZSWI3]
MSAMTNMRCEEVVEHLLTFLDGEVEEERRSLMERHLEECRSCCSRADFELALRHKIREVAAKRPSSGLSRRIREIIDRF